MRWADMTFDEQRKFKLGMERGRKDFAALSTADKWLAGDDLVLGSFSAREWAEVCGHAEGPPVGWKRGFSDASDHWTMYRTTE